MQTNKLIDLTSKCGWQQRGFILRGVMTAPVLEISREFRTLTMGSTKKAPSRKRSGKASSGKVTMKGTNTPYSLNKGAKHAARREVWNKRIGNAMTEKDRRKRGQVKGGVFNPEDLMLSLPQVTSVEEPKKQGKKKDASQQSTDKSKHLPNPHKFRNRTKLFAEEARQFSRVLEHPAFKQNASQAIHQHIVNKMKQEQV